VNITGRWAEASRFAAGSHIAVFSHDPDIAAIGRLLGFEFRDTILVLHPGPRTSFIFLFRAPVAGSVAEQVLQTGTGGLHIGASRIGGLRWPTNLVLVHSQTCGTVCASECPAVTLDRQSGERPAGGAITTSNQGPAAGSYHGGGSGASAWSGYGDAGGASRFYPSFKDVEELASWVARLIGADCAPHSTIVTSQQVHDIPT